MADKSSTDGRKNRVVVNLPAEVGDTLDNIAINLAAVVKETAGLDVKFSRAQVIESLAAAEQARQDALWDARNGGENPS